MSNFNSCFLTCIHVSQEAGKVIWFSHLFKNFPVFCDPHSQGFNIVNEAEVDVFQEFWALPFEYLFFFKMKGISLQINKA